MVSYSIYDWDNRVRRYAETLTRHGHHVDVVALRPEPNWPEQGVINEVNVFRVQTRIKNEKGKLDYLARMSAFFLRSMFFLTREHLKNPYDLIHVHSLPDFEVFAALIPKLKGAKIILDIHDIVPEFYASKFNVPYDSPTFKALVTVEKLSAAFCDHVVAANHIWEERLQKRSVPKNKLTTILNFPDTEIFVRRGRTRGHDKFIILYPGSLNYHQGLDIAVRAFARIKDQVPQAEFHIYGGGELVGQLRDLIAALKLEDRVLLRPAVSMEEMVGLIENADLGIVPKRKDGFGNEAFSTKILEFMSMGVPVIVPDTMVDKFYFNDDVVRFFEANDEQSLADAILDLAKHPQAMRELTRNADKFVQQYTWDVNQSLYLNLVEGLVSRDSEGKPTRSVSL